MGRRVKGVCRLCGKYTKLTFEHIPPKSAFNDELITFQTLQDITKGRSHSKFRRGMGLYSLCGDCNSRTGGWYGTDFAKWTRQGFAWLNKLGSSAGVYQLPYYIKPLNVLKQVATMALATFPDVTALYHNELRRFVLNREQKYLSPDNRFYVYFNQRGSRV